jgi:hypothetical protein
MESGRIQNHSTGQVLRGSRCPEWWSDKWRSCEGEDPGGYNLLGVVGPEFDATITVVKKHLQTSLAPLGNEPSQLIQAHIFAQFPRNNGK